MAHDVQQLVDMGFAYPEAEVALREAGGNMEQALELLLTGAQPEPEVEQSRRRSIRQIVSAHWPEMRLPLTTNGPNCQSSPTSGYAKGSDRPPGLDRAKDDLCAAWDLSMEDLRTLYVFFAVPVSCVCKPRLSQVQDGPCFFWSVLSLKDMVPTPQMPRPPGLPCGLLNVGNTCHYHAPAVEFFVCQVSVVLRHFVGMTCA